MSKFEHYRKTLAHEVSALSSRTEKQKRIDSEKESNQEYWQARQEYIDKNQEEEAINGGEGILVRKKTLYHGSATPEIKEFEESKERTIGNGIYLTSHAQKAIGYADVRSRAKEPAILYEVIIENLKLCDLRKNINVAKIAVGFGEKLRTELVKIPNRRVKNNIIQTLELIDAGEITADNIRDVSFNFLSWFTDYIKSLGYDGLITFEGGDGNIGSHDSYVIFDPKKVKINQEQKMISGSFIPKKEDEDRLRDKIEKEKTA